MPARHAPMPVSIIIPTYQEADNLPTLIQRIASIDWQQRSFEVLIVDDNSQDDSEQIILQLQTTHSWLKLIKRHGERGLSKSILEGFAVANHPLLIAMDADLSHPPEKIPLILSTLEKPPTDMVIGSRYTPGGSIDSTWPFYRKLVSRCSAYLARLLLPTPVKDPLSGFIAIRQQTYRKADTLNPIGWKIGLELMIKCHCRHIVEIPISFQERQFGKSKLSLATGMDYLKQLMQLVVYQYHVKTK